MASRARATITGNNSYPKIKGEVYFTKINYYVEVVARIYSLPKFSRENGTTIGPFAFHIHNGNSCDKGSLDNPFPFSGSHYNPDKQPHGNHAGDFPVLIPLKDGSAVMRFITDKFTIDQVIGLPVVIHLSPDDYRTEPAGKSGEKIACGIIKAF